MPLFASNFDGLLSFIFGIPIALVALGLLSFWPATRGHWSAPVLAAPGMLIGLFLKASLLMNSRKDLLMPALWVLFPAPLLMGVASVILWSLRRDSR